MPTWRLIRRRTSLPIATTLTLVLAAATLAGPASTQPTVDQRLEERVAEINLEGMTLGQFLDKMRTDTGTNIFVNWRELERIGIDRGAQLFGKLRNVSARTVFKYVLESLGEPTQVTMHVEGDVLWIGTADRTRTELRVYNLTKLLNVIAVDGKIATTRPADPDQRLDDVIKLITTTVEPAGWSYSGGSVGSVSAIGARLCIIQTPENHAAIRVLLDKLEKADGK